MKNLGNQPTKTCGYGEHHILYFSKIAKYSPKMQKFTDYSGILLIRTLIKLQIPGSSILVRENYVILTSPPPSQNHPLAHQPPPPRKDDIIF